MSGNDSDITEGAGDSADADTRDAGKVVHADKSKCKHLPVLGTSISALDYNMDFKKRGVLLLFNHKNFDPSLKLGCRNGTDKDGERAKCVFEKLGFEVRPYFDMPYHKVMNIIADASEEDHKDNACFACMVLSHGEEGGLVYANNLMYKTSSLWEPFLGDNCPSLAGKPKLFFIQACQGTKVDAGLDVMATDALQVVKIPSHADFLIACSTVPGFYSWRNTSDGSWFVQALCNVLTKHHNTIDLLSMLTMVNREVAFDFHSNCPGDQNMHNMKQIPCITTMLTRRVFLRDESKTKPR